MRQMASDELTIGGPGVPYTVTFSNPSGVALPEVFAQGEIIQGGVTRGAGGFNLLCPPDDLDAVLPPGDCTVVWTATALGFSGPDGALAAGAATFVLTLHQGFSAPVSLDSWSIPVTLVEANRRPSRTSRSRLPRWSSAARA